MINQTDDNRGLLKRRNAVFAFFHELSLANLAFWNRPNHQGRTDAYLLTVAIGLIYLARHAFAAFANPVFVPAAAIEIVVAAAILAGLGCLVDSRNSRSELPQRMRDVYRLNMIGFCISAALISTNIIFHWAVAIRSVLSLYPLEIEPDGFAELAVTPVLPATVFSFGSVLAISLGNLRFRASWKNEKIRVSSWAAYFFLAIFILTLLLFRNDWPQR